MSTRTSSLGRRIRRTAAAAALSGALLLAGCTGLPMEGPVTVSDRSEGDPSGDGVGNYIVDPPSRGAEPQQIVDGFLNAAINPTQNWANARDFLSEDFAEAWNPSAGVILDRPRERSLSQEDGEASAQVSVDLSPAAFLDDGGRYLLAAGADEPLVFELSRNDEGEWRISSAPDGIVLDQQYFELLFSPQELFYFDPSWSFLVPERRWFLNRADMVTPVVQQLIGGRPGEWLAPGVRTAFGNGITRANGSIPVDSESRTAEVEVEGASGASEEVLSRMRAQLAATLAPLDVRDVELTVDGQRISVESAESRSTRVDARPLVLTEEGFGFLSGGELTRIGGLSDSIEELAADEDIEAITVSADHTLAAVLLAGGESYRITADGNRGEIDTGGESIAPTIDPFGYVWTVRGDNPGTLSAWNADLVRTAMGDAWADVSEVSAISLSRDGTRLAAVVTIGGEQWTVVSAIERDAEGAPQSLGQLMRVTQLRMPGRALTWLDSSTLGIASGSADGANFVRQVVGGPGGEADASTTPLGVTTVTAGNQESSARLLTGSGELQILRADRWQSSTGGVEVLATQLGQPG
jgi:hypothetical protein